MYIFWRSLLKLTSMRASIIIILVFLLTQSCREKADKIAGIEIVLENTEVACIKKPADKYHLFYSHNESDSAKTILKFRLINHTNKRQLLVFDPFSPLTGNMRTIIYGRDGKKIKPGPSLIDPVATPEYVAEFQKEMDFHENEVKKYKDFITGSTSTYKNYRENAVILEPGEERAFVSSVSLPILYSESASAMSYYDITGAKYFSLWYTLSSNLRFYREAIPDWEQQDLARRGIHWYTDSIFSNKIPIRFMDTSLTKRGHTE